MSEKFKNLEQLESIVSTLDDAELRSVVVGGKQSDSYSGIWNLNKDILEGIIESKYGLIKHQVAFGQFITASKQMGFNGLNGVIKNFGGQVIVEARIPELVINQDTDPVQVGVRLENSYLNKPAFKGESFGFRNACENGMFFGQIDVSKVFSGHSKKLASLQIKISELLTKISGSSENIKKYIDEAQSQVIHVDEAKAIINGEVWGKKVIREIIGVMEVEDDNTTKYNVYNAMTFYATHKAKNEEQRTSIQKIAQKILSLPIEKLKKSEFKEDEVDNE